MIYKKTNTRWHKEDLQKIGPSQLTEGDHLKGALLRSGCLIDHLQDGTRSGVHEN